MKNSRKGVFLCISVSPHNRKPGRTYTTELVDLRLFCRNLILNFKICFGFSVYFKIPPSNCRAAFGCSGIVLETFASLNALYFWKKKSDCTLYRALTVYMYSSVQDDYLLDFILRLFVGCDRAHHSFLLC